jgi:hypothetical protein
LAAARLKAYVESDCLPHHREMVLANVAHLESSDTKPDMRLLRDFMLFTNDLDASREQCIQETDPELLDLLAAAGFTWTQETLHVARGRAAAASSPL